jgi:hypothetical protein
LLSSPLSLPSSRNEKPSTCNRLTMSRIRLGSSSTLHPRRRHKDATFPRCNATVCCASPPLPPPVAIVTIVTIVGGNFLCLVDRIGRSFAQWCYPVPPHPAREAAPLILCSVISTVAAPALPQGRKGRSRSQHSRHSAKNRKWWIQWSQGGALRCPRRKIWEERTVPVPISRAYMRGP